MLYVQEVDTTLVGGRNGAPRAFLPVFVPSGIHFLPELATFTSRRRSMGKQCYTSLGAWVVDVR